MTTKPSLILGATLAIGFATAVSAAARNGQGAGNTANVDVTVIPAPIVGQPPPSREGFTVCIGTSADRDQYGRQTTPASGVANQNFRNLPTGAPVLITVEKAGYRGWEQTRTLTADWSNHVQAQVQAGTGGATCGAPAIGIQPTATASVNVQRPGNNPIGRDDSIRIMEINVNNGVTYVWMNDQLRIHFRYAGPEPQEMRISETSGNFPETWANWTTFARHPGGPLSNGMDYVFYGATGRTLQSEFPRKTMYLQFRRDGRVSNIGTVTVDVKKKHVIDGVAAYVRAMSEGFLFLTTTPLNLGGSDRCRIGGTMGPLEFIAPRNSLTGHCVFAIFTARTLKAPWTFDSWTWSLQFANSCEPVVFRSNSNSNSLAASVRVPFLLQSSGLATCSYLLSSITLVGPAATPWANAFAR